jgi:hypothetical protein
MRSCLCLILLFVSALGLEQAQPAQTDNRTKADGIVAELQTSGAKVERPRAVVYFQPGLLSAADQERWADLISDGITNIERLLHLSFGDTRLEYYVSGKVTEMSFSFAGIPGDRPPRTFLASDRVQRGAAPYLHEAVHHLVFRYTPKRTASPLHLWIFEGFPSYVENAVVARFGGVAGHVFDTAGNESIDADARAALLMPRRRELLAFVGRAGVPPDLPDRVNVAKPFYLMGQSLTKHLIDTVGLDAFVQSLLPHLLNAEMFEAEVQRLCGKSLERVTADWLERIEHAGPMKADTPQHAMN